MFIKLFDPWQLWPYFPKPRCEDGECGLLQGSPVCISQALLWASLRAPSWAGGVDSTGALTCSSLGLQEVNITDLSNTREEDKRFTFIRSDNGPTTSFESAACPGWFLCTELEADQPVSVTNTPKDAIKVTKFYFQQG